MLPFFVVGEGLSARYKEEMFQKRLIIMKRWVDADELLQLEVLNSVQVGLAFLKMPRGKVSDNWKQHTQNNFSSIKGIISRMFDSLYNIEVVSEESLIRWRDRPTEGVEDYGRDVALEEARPFFEWLHGADYQSDND